jgi:hypothetical protein
MFRKNQNLGPCAIVDCKNTDVIFKKITVLSFEKLQEYPDYENVNYLKLNDQLCHPHYMKYIEPKKRRKLNDDEKKKTKDVNENISIKDIEVKFTEDGVLLSEEDFKLFVHKINDMELTIEKNKKQIEELIEADNVYLTSPSDIRESKYNAI